MLATTTRVSLRALSRGGPSVVKAIACRNFSPLSDTLKGKEKVEEDRFMKAQEKEFIEKKRKKMAEKMHVEEEAIFKEKVAPAMAEAQNVLKKAGGASVSHDALEALAKWKLNM